MPLKYRISDLGWYNFETLVQTMLKAVIGPGVTSFGGTKDGGRDATFNGEANYPSENTRWEGYWLFQVKYVDYVEQGVATARTQLKNTFQSEIQSLLAKARKSGQEGIVPNNYILITNIPLTAKNRKDLELIARACSFQGNYASVDGKEICEFLDIFPDIRRSYPQLLGLTDLQHIVNQEQHVRSEAYVQTWQPRLGTFVRTSAYEEALTALRSHHFIVLDGAPEAGKSTIAAAVALVQTTYGFELVDLRTPDEFYKCYEQGRSQLFVADDAVGSIAFDPSLTESWSRDLSGILTKLDRNHWLIWTARSYVLESAIAQSRLGEAVSDFPGVNEVLVEVGSMSQQEKAEILYNHAKQAQLSKLSRDLIRANAGKIIRHPNFTPERIRQLTEHILTRLPSSGEEQLKVVEWSEVDAFLNNPGDRWVKAYQQLSPSEKALLSGMLDFNYGATEDEIQKTYALRVGQLNGSHLEFEDCLNRLTHSFVRKTTSYIGQTTVAFQHPSLRDMLLMELRRDPAGRIRYIELASPTGLANLIGGLSRPQEPSDNDRHVLRLTEQGEVSAMLSRLEEVSRNTLPVSNWDALLSASDLLIPRMTIQHESNPLQNGSNEWDTGELFEDFNQIMARLFHPPSIVKLRPNETNLPEFSQSHEGMVVAAVLRVFGRAEILQLNQQYDLGEWVQLLEKFYGMAEYISPPPHVEFLSQLTSKLTTECEESSVKLAGLMAKFEPMVLNQQMRNDTLEAWDQEIREQLESFVQEGQLFTPQFLYEDEFSDSIEYVNDPDWYEQSGQAIQLAEEFYPWAPFSPPDSLQNLDQLREDVGPFPDHEDHEDHDGYTRSRDTYWTVERLFEDL